jgi:hypothetical protein
MLENSFLLILNLHATCIVSVRVKLKSSQVIYLLEILWMALNFLPFECTYSFML